MELYEIEKMRKLEETHWWFQGKKYIIKSILSSIQIPEGRLLDVGCGTGMFLSEFGRGRTAFGIDSSEQALSYCTKKADAFLVRATGNKLPFKDEVFSFVTLLDILEHVDNDLELMNEVYRVCKLNAIVVITVPAFNFLWGSHDVFHHHRRRYVREQLKNLGLSAGFMEERLTYTNFSIFLPVLLRRIATRKISLNKESDMKQTPVLINSFLKFIYKLEAFYLKKANFPFGVSLLIVLRKLGKSRL